MEACEWGYSDIVKLLVEAKADTNKIDNGGETALIKLLRKKNWRFFEQGESNLSIAALLINAGANVNQADKTYNTPLAIAAFNGYNDTVRLLIAAGADTALKNKEGNTALHRAIDQKQKQEKIVKNYRYIDDLLKEKISTESANMDMHSAQLSEKLCVKAEKKEYRDDQWEMIEAIQLNSIDKVKSLIQQSGFDINGNLGLYNTPLSMAITKGHADIVKLLLNSNAAVHIKDRFGGTPLDTADWWHNYHQNILEEYNDIIMVLERAV